MPALVGMPILSLTLPAAQNCACSIQALVLGHMQYRKLVNCFKRYIASADALLKLCCQRRVILTGTPVQNNLDEFYGAESVLDFACWSDAHAMLLLLTLPSTLEACTACIEPRISCLRIV